MQIHFPFPFFKQTTLADGLQEAMDLGLTTAVGVCNYNTAQLEEMHGLLDKKSIPLATNQVTYDICCQRVNHGLLHTVMWAVVIVHARGPCLGSPCT